MDMGCRSGAREPVDLAGSWSPAAITSCCRGCAMGAAWPSRLRPQGKSWAPILPTERQW